ncbi:ATP-binding protein [Zobellia nedashkovskayae]
MVDFGIDQLFIADRIAIINGNVSPGRPSPVTALCFVLLGIAFVYIQSTKKHLRKLSQYLFYIVSFIAIVGYLFHVPVFYKLSFFTSMAVHISISLFVISISLTIVNPKFGIARVFIGKRIGNIMARSIFKKVLPAILILGFTQLVLLRYGIVSVDFGIAIFMTCFIIIFLYSLWSTKILLNRIDEEKRAARNKLKEINKNLLSNSLKYHSKNRKPEIKFETKSIGAKVELSAIDNGLGIDLELNKDRIFGLHKTFHKHPEAKGVGLFITKAQVEAMGGKISVESKVNNGSTFKILF